MNALSQAGTPARLGLLAAASLTALFVLSSLFRSPSASHAISRAPGTVLHLVLFSYTASTTNAEKDEIASAFMGLKDACTRDGKPYILDIDGGRNHSPEDAGKEFEHAYLLTFASRSDRDFYVNIDSAHMAFKSSLGGRVARVTVHDFDAGEFPALAEGMLRKRIHGRRKSEEVHVRRV